MDFKRIFASQKARILALGLILNLTTFPVFAALSAVKFESLEKEFQSVSSQIYASLSQNLRQCKGKTTSLKRLNSQLEKLVKQSKPIIGLCLIRNHLKLIKTNIDNKEIFSIFQYLLDNNNIEFANKIYQIAKNESDQSFISNLSFIYAKYYIKREQWNKSLHYLKGSYNDLTRKDANLALLLTGIALQKIKQHRKAVKIYLKIPQKSEYYPAARLNIATAYIRQGWWTDAHIKIEDLIKNKKINTHNEMINRLYLVLGYSLLRKEFHRDSREAFRNIEIGSAYFNKALLGIALTAANQEDYIGSLNAINILKDKQLIDLSVDESHLLQPYLYEKLNQNMTASASYASAQTYFRKRIEDITAIKNHHQITAHKLLNKDQLLKVENNIITTSRHLQRGFVANNVQLEKLKSYQPYISNKNLSKQYRALKDKYNLAFKSVINDVFEQRIAYLERYMNQSRYGIARLFDHSNKEH